MEPSNQSREASLKIGRSSFLYSLGILISRVSGMAREMLTAYFFGATAEMGSFFLAFRFSHLVRRLCGEGGLLVGFVPQYMRYRTESSLFALQFFKRLIFYLFAILGGSVLLGEFFLQGSPSFELQLVGAFLPGLLFVCLSGFLAAFLQCEGKFFLSGVISVIFNIAWVTSCILTTHLSIEKGLLILAWATTVSFLLQFLLLAIPSIRIMIRFSKEAPQSQGKQELSFDRVFKPLLTSLTFSTLAVGISQINGFVDTLFAKFADPRGPALLSYAIRLQQFPLSIFAISASAALLPTLSGLFKREDRDHFSATFAKTWIVVTGMLLLSTVLLFSLGESALELILGRGKFTERDLMETTQVLWCYALSLVPMGSHLLLSSACYSLGKGREVVISSFLALFMNCLLNAACVFGFGWGVKSIAVATAVSSLFASFYLGGALKKEAVLLPIKAFLYRVAIALSLGLILTVNLDIWFSDPSLAILSDKAPTSMGSGPSFLRLLFGGSFTLLFGYSASRFGNVKEWDFLSALRRMLFKRAL